MILSFEQNLLIHHGEKKRKKDKSSDKIIADQTAVLQQGFVLEARYLLVEGISLREIVWGYREENMEWSVEPFNKKKCQSGQELCPRQTVLRN